MRIFYCTDLVLDTTAAPTIHVRALCDQFARAGHDVTLFAPRFGIASHGAYEEVRILTPRRLLSVFFQPQLLLRLLTHALRARPDVLYVRHSHLLIVPTLLGKFFKIPVVLEVNGILEQDAEHINKTLRSRILLASGTFSFLERSNARLAALIIAVTPGIKEYFVTRYRAAPEKIAVIRNGVDTDLFKPMPRGEARRTLGLAADKMYIGYIGSLHEWQGVRYLALIAAALRAAYPQVCFLIVGDGEERAFLGPFIHEHVLDNVELRPAVSHDTVPRYINSFDICINYPLKFRNGATSPFKVYEYLACGKPVVSSDLSSIRGEFGDSLAYADPESAESLADAVRHLIDNPGEREARAAKARAFVERGHSWRAVASAILERMTTLS